MQILRERGLLLKEEKKKKKKNMFDIVEMTEEAFLEKYVVRFGDETAEELLVAYKSHLLNNDDDADSSCSSHEDCSLITD